MRCRAAGYALARRQREPLARQQLPVAVLLLPDLQYADPGRRRLAVELGLGEPNVARDGRVAGHGHLELREGERFDYLLACHHGTDELLLGLDASTGVTVAELG